MIDSGQLIIWNVGGSITVQRWVSCLGGLKMGSDGVKGGVDSGQKFVRFQGLFEDLQLIMF